MLKIRRIKHRKVTRLFFILVQYLLVFQEQNKKNLQELLIIENYTS